MSAKKLYVFRSPVAGAKLHVPTDDGVETFVADEPRGAPAKMIEELREQGYQIEDADHADDQDDDQQSRTPERRAGRRLACSGDRVR